MKVMSPLFFLSWTMLVLMCLVTLSRADMNDVDSMDSSSDTSSTGEMDNDIQPVDPNLVNPPSGQGYGNEMRNNNPEDWPQNRDKTSPRPPGSPTQTPTVRPTWAEQSLRALLQFGIIVSYSLFRFILSCQYIQFSFSSSGNLFYGFPSS